MQQKPSVEMQLQALELRLLEPGVRGSEPAAQLLAEGFVEFGSSGRTFTREQALAAMRAESSTRCTVTQFKVRLLAPHVALVTYRAHRHGVPPVDSLRSSLWEHRQGQWQMLFHQGTPA